MTVGVLQQFLRSLIPALDGAGDGKAARELGESLTALEPFQSLEIQAFGTFLVRAHELKASGTVAVPTPGEEHVDAVAKVFARLHGAADGFGSIQQEIAAALQKLAAQAGLKGKLTADAKWAEAREIQAKLAPHRAALMHLAARIQSPDAFAEPIVQDGIARLAEQFDGTTLKGLAAEVGVKATGKALPHKVVVDMLVKLSGHQPPKVKATRKAASVDPAEVEEHSQRLTALIARSVNPDAVSDGDIEAEVALLKGLAQPALFEVVTRAGMREARSSESKPALLKRVQTELTAARRARERAEV